MTTDHEVSRTLVKSPPELWAECSDAASLARHLNQSFGEIQITRLEPETAVAWEGEHVSGTVRIEPSAWGTRVTLTAQTSEEAVIEAPAAAEPAGAEPAAEEPAAEEPAAEEPAAEEPAADAASNEPDRPTPEEPAPIATGEIPPARALPPAPKLGLMARLRRLFRRGAEEEVVPPAKPPEPDPPAEPERIEAAQEIATEPEASAGEAAQEIATGPEASIAPEAEDSSASAPPVDAEAALTAALDSLGQAHHRPFSRG